MRQVYASPRFGNVERLAALFNENDIQTRIGGTKAYRKSGYSSFSYRDSSREAWVQLWIVRAEDFARARDLMREIGIEPMSESSHILQEHRRAKEQRGDNGMLGVRLRRVLIVVALVLAAIILWRRFL